MDIIMYKKTMDFISALHKDRGGLHIHGIEPTKSRLPSCSSIHTPFPRAIPEAVGIKSDYLLSFLMELSEKPHLRPHALMMMKDGKIFLETEFYPYRLDTWHVSHSMAKSITALAIGCLVDESRLSLDEKLSDIFVKRTFSVDFVRQKEITVRHLLNMSAGVSFNELGSVTDEDWIEGFFSAGVKFTPGTKFMYNSMNSYMLSAIVREKTGVDMFDFLCERLFTPMGITEVFWEKCPKGITKGGWGLYMKMEDLMKFGKLFLDHGAWNGKHLVSANWIHEMTEKQMGDTLPMSDHGYGFHIWRSGRENSYQFNGMMGQNLVIMPDIKLVIATYSGNAEMFPKSDYMTLIDKYFGNGFTPQTIEKPSRRMNFAVENYARSLALPKPIKPAERMKRLASFSRVLDKTYRIDAKQISLLPLALCFLHNNYYGSITKISFRQNDTLIEAIFEKEDESIVIPFSADGTASYFEFRENGEPFSAAAIGKMTKNEDDIPVLKLSIYFLETTSIRHIKFFFHRGKTIVRFSEEPDGIEFLDGFRPAIDDYAQKSKTAQKLLSKVEETGLVDYNFEKLFSPEFLAIEE